MTLTKQLTEARREVNRHAFGTDAWETGMVEVRRLVAAIDAQRAPEEFCSVDSGVHRTRLRDGRVVS